MPTRIATNWEPAYLRFDSGKPIKIEDVICYTDEPAEEEACTGIDLSSSDSFTCTFEMQLTCKEYKRISSIVGRGNNWRRMHGKRLIRVPLKERRKHE
jgi:hypothetical protein